MEERKNKKEEEEEKKRKPKKPNSHSLSLKRNMFRLERDEKVDFQGYKKEEEQ
jgi:hypothetical protein